MYEYRVQEAVKIVDGDTFDLRLDLGFYASGAYRFRLAGIDTPEIFGRNAEPLGQDARAFAEAWITEALSEHDLHARTFKLSEVTPVADGGFGRWLVDLFRPSTSERLSEALLAAGFGEQALQVSDPDEPVHEPAEGEGGHDRPPTESGA